MGLCEDLGIERDDYSEDISDDEWARRWEALYRAERCSVRGGVRLQSTKAMLQCSN